MAGQTSEFVIDLSDTSVAATGTPMAELTDTVVACWKKSACAMYISDIRHLSDDRSSQLYDRVRIIPEPDVDMSMLQARLRASAQATISHHNLQARSR